jgi:hypothetical protein
MKDIIKNGQQVAGTCNATNPQLSDFTNRQICGGSKNTHLGWYISVSIKPAVDRQYEFEIGSNYGNGWIYEANGAVVSSGHLNNWWNYNWGYSRIIKSGVVNAPAN